ncbi:DNA-binding response regulator [Cyclobacteriaceae bacterium YHN15]|nr:DNA-binding response regulator [Cyclobacteriaceae bacterium YHN15]
MKNILIVEDELDLGQNIQELLKYLGYTVSGIIDNGKDVLDFLKENTPDLILMDIQIKGDIDGITLCKKIKSIYDIPVVYLTAFSDISFLDRISSYPYEGYLLKPFTVEELKTTVHLGLNAKKKKGIKPEKNIITIKDKGFTVPISTQDILFFQADGLYTKIQTKTKSYVVRDILKDLIDSIRSSRFIRVHKSYVINVKEIDSFNSKEIHIQDFVIPLRRGFYKEIKSMVKERD